MDNEFGMLNDNEVLFVRSGRILMSNPTFKVSEFLDALAQLISEQEGRWSEEQEGWFTDRGMSCEVLRFSNQGWQRGRVRIRLEFAPDTPKLLRESPPRREDIYPAEDLGRREDPYRRRGGRGEGYPADDPYRWNNRDDVYPADIYPDEDEY